MKISLDLKSGGWCVNGELGARGGVCWPTGVPPVSGRVLGSALCLLVVYKLWPLFRQWWIASRFPGISFLESWRRIGELQHLLREWMQKNKQYRNWYTVWFAFNLNVLTADPECAKWLFKQPELEKTTRFIGSSRKFIKELNSHILFANGEDWKRQRTALNIGFGREAYNNYYPTFNSVIDKCLTKLHQIPKGSDFNIAPYFSKFTLDLLGRSIFHYDFNNLDTEDNKYYEAYRTIISAGGQANRMLVELVPGWSSLPFFAPKRVNDAIDVIKGLFKHVIEDHRQEGATYKDVLDKLLQAQAIDHNLSEVELYSNIFVLFAAGHETTATALAWAFAELADKQELQETLYEHIISEFPSGTPPVESILEPPALLDSFIKENLRHHPPVPVIPTRRSEKDLKCGKDTIPGGARVGVDVWAIHHNPEYWENPDVFDLERFLPERRKGKHKFSYLPFGLGARQCIGNEFSEIEQRLFLVKFLREFKVLPPLHQPKTDLNKQPNFATAFPVYVTLSKRNL